MKSTRWKDIEAALRKNKPMKPSADAQSFWSDFRSRAGFRRQEKAVSPVLPIFIPRWALAGACAAILLLVVGVQTFRAPAPQEASRIDSLEVFASHSAVFIMEDEDSHSMIIWIADMDADSGNGESLL